MDNLTLYEILGLEPSFQTPSHGNVPLAAIRAVWGMFLGGQCIDPEARPV